MRYPFSDDDSLNRLVPEYPTGDLVLRNFSKEEHAVLLRHQSLEMKFGQ